MPPNSLPAPGDRDSLGITEDLRRLLKTASQSWPIIVVSVATCLTAATIYLARKTTLYQATSRMLVVQHGASPIHLTGGDQGRANTNEDYLPTQALIIRSPLVVRRAIESIERPGLSTQAVIERLTVSRPDQAAKVLQLSYLSEDVEEATAVIEGVVSSYESFLNDHYHQESRNVADLLKKARDELSKDLESLEKQYLELVRKSPDNASDDSGRYAQERRIEQWERAVGETHLKAIQLKAQLELGRSLAKNGASFQAMIQAMDQLGGVTSSLALASDRGDPKRAARLRLVEELADLELRRLAGERLLDELSAKGADSKVDEDAVNRLLNAEPDVAQARDEIKDAESRLAAAKRVARSPNDPAIKFSANQVASLRESLEELKDELRPTIAEQLARNESDDDEIRRAKADLAAVRSREQTVKQKLVELDAELARSLDTKKKELSARLGADNPQVIALSAQLDQIRRGGSESHDHEAVQDLLEAIGRGLATVESMREEIQQKFTVDLRASKKSEVDRLAMESLRDNMERQRSLFNTVVDQLKQVQFTGDFSGITAQILEPPSTSPIRPNLVLVLGVALASGLVIGLGLAFGSEQLDQRLHTVDEIRRTLDLPVLGLIPLLVEGPLKTPGGVGMLGHVMPRSSLAESFRMLRTNFELRRRSQSVQVLLVTSPLPGDGKSTTASNLAISLAQAGRRVLLIDADLRRPTLDSVHGVPRECGLSQVLTDEIPLHEAIRQGSLPNLDVMTAGSDSTNPAELLTSPRLGEVFHAVRQNYDAVIVDSPPLLPVADGIILGGAVDGILLVLRASKIRRQDAIRTTEVLETIGTSAIGIVVNGVDRRSNGHSYGYGYGYGQADGRKGLPAEDSVAARSKRLRGKLNFLSSATRFSNGEAEAPALEDMD